MANVASARGVAESKAARSTKQSLTSISNLSKLTKVEIKTQQLLHEKPNYFDEATPEELVKELIDTLISCNTCNGILTEDEKIINARFIH